MTAGWAILDQLCASTARNKVAARNEYSLLLPLEANNTLSALLSGKKLTVSEKMTESVQSTKVEAYLFLGPFRRLYHIPLVSNSWLQHNQCTYRPPATVRKE